ncbi:MAG TPA: hypothetical protein VMJ66_09345 [Geobacteraceae bacterium]|nr:hypothetical protein [Geobacteraceae bacterium]
MTDNEKWDRGVAAVRKEFAALGPALTRRLMVFAAAIKSRKVALHSAAEEAGAGAICGECRGECCHRGKNHVTVVDLLVYLCDGRELFTPCFERDICPYLAESGCIMDPEYRPYNCITFICERIEDGLEPSRKELFYGFEQELRTLYEEFERLFDNSFRYGLMRTMERSLPGGPAPILRGAALDGP